VRAVLPLGEGVVLDPFAGAGSTLAAAEALGYDSIGTEHDPHYFKIAIEAIPLLKELSSGGRATSREASLFPRDGASRSGSRAHPENSSESALFALPPGTRR
jgi:DNA methylase